MNTITKITTTLPILALLSACATTAPTMPSNDLANTDTTKNMANVAYDRMAPAPYTCTDNSKIMAKQSINKKQAMITATVPKVKWSAQPIILNGGVQGDVASYVNDSNPEVVYAWHMKGDKGILAMKWANSKEYQVNCQI